MLVRPVSWASQVLALGSAVTLLLGHVEQPGSMWKKGHPGDASPIPGSGTFLLPGEPTLPVCKSCSNGTTERLVQGREGKPSEMDGQAHAVPQ